MRYTFDAYLLDTACYELYRSGMRVPLRPKVLEVLAYLVVHHDRVVSKQELLAQLWPGQVIGEDGLKAYIMAVRQALGDRGPAPRLLRTVRGRGYRFVALVTVGDTAGATVPPPPSHLVVPPEGVEVPGRLAPPPAVPDLASPGTVCPVVAEEYKLVSVLCSALPDTLALAMQLDPEALYRLLHAVSQVAQEVIHRYEGTLIQQTSEGWTAVFGVPVAQEDHARRAVLTALELHQRLHEHAAFRGQGAGAALALQMGIHSGRVVVGEVGQAAFRVTTVVGAPIQLARRLQAQAAPGTLLLSATTYYQVQAEVRGAPQGSLVLEGLQEPLPIYAVQGLAQRRAGVPQRATPVRSPFVGRQRELALLHDRLALVQTGEGQVVSLVGPPGIGKTRLLTEFGRALAPDQVTWVLGQCLAYGQGTPYLPVRDLLQQVCRLTASDPLEARTAAVRCQLAALGEVAEEDVALVLQLLNLPVAAARLERLAPEARQARTFTILEHLLRHVAQGQPLVLAVENVQWIDPTSAACLGFLSERLAGMAVLLLLTQRPDAPPPWGAHAAVTQLALPPLRTEDSQAIIAAVPGTAQLPAAQRQQLVAHGAGNPFFLEELAWDAVEHSLAATPSPVPETVQAVLAARLDRLPAVTKDLLQRAAVIGLEVPLPLLQTLAALPEDTVQQSLAHLQATQVLYETRLLPERVYTFKHALTQEVAYGSLLQGQRRMLHARVVEAIEALAPEQGAEQVERLAHHALRGEVWDKAVTYCQQAGAMAHDRAALREARSSFEQALQALDHLHEDGATRALASDLRLALSRVLQPLGEYGQCLVLLGEAEALARAIDDRTRTARVLSRLTQVRRITGDLDGAIAAGRQVYELAARLGERVLQMRSSLILGEIYYVIGNFRRAAELLRHNVEVTDRKLDKLSTALWIDSQAWLARTLSVLGAFAEGRRHGEEALRLAMLEGYEETPIAAHACLGSVYLDQGDLEPAIRVLEQGLALCRASGNRSGFARMIVAGLGYVAVLQGCLAAGRALLDEALDESIRIGARQAPQRVAWLSEVCRLEGRGAEAWQHACQALDLARQQKVQGEEALALHQLGVVQAHAEPPDVVQAATHYHQALALAEALGIRPLQAHCHRGLGTLYAKTGQREQARAALSTAIALYRAMDMTFWLPQTEAALAQVEG